MFVQSMVSEMHKLKNAMQGVPAELRNWRASNRMTLETLSITSNYQSAAPNWLTNEVQQGWAWAVPGRNVSWVRKLRFLLWPAGGVHNGVAKKSLKFTKEMTNGFSYWCQMAYLSKPCQVNHLALARWVCFLFHMKAELVAIVDDHADHKLCIAWTNSVLQSKVWTHNVILIIQWNVLAYYTLKNGDTIWVNYFFKKPEEENSTPNSKTQHILVFWAG